MKLTRRRLKRLIESILNESNLDDKKKIQEMISSVKSAQVEFAQNDSIVFLLSMSIGAQKRYENNPDKPKEEDDRPFWLKSSGPNIQSMPNPHNESLREYEKALRERGITSDIDTIEAKRVLLSTSKSHAETSRDKFNKAFRELSKLGNNASFELQSKEGEITHYGGWEDLSLEVKNALGDTFKDFDAINYDLLHYQNEAKFSVNKILSQKHKYGFGSTTYNNPERVAKSKQAYEVLLALEAYANQQ